MGSSKRFFRARAGSPRCNGCRKPGRFFRARAGSPRAVRLQYSGGRSRVLPRTRGFTERSMRYRLLLIRSLPRTRGFTVPAPVDGACPGFFRARAGSPEVVPASSTARFFRARAGSPHDNGLMLRASWLFRARAGPAQRHRLAWGRRFFRARAGSPGRRYSPLPWVGSSAHARVHRTKAPPSFTIRRFFCARAGSPQGGRS